MISNFACYDPNRGKAVTTDNPHSEAPVKIVRESLQLRHDDRVLDIGCFDGYLLQRLMDATPFSSGAGIGISEYGIRLARSLVSAPNLTFAQGMAECLPFDDESFDKIICSEIIEHVPDDVAAMREIYRVCRRDGRA